MTFNIGLVWFRRDIRAHDHAALSHALAECRTVYTIFVFDPNILNPIKKKAVSDRRVQFICESVSDLDAQLRSAGGGIMIRHGDPVTVIPAVAAELGADAVYFNRDYSPYALKRDAAVAQQLATENRVGRSFKDCVIFEPDEVVTQSGDPYKVFTPYARAWRQRLTQLGPVMGFSYQLCNLKPDPNHSGEPWSAPALLHQTGFEPEFLDLAGGRTEGLRRLAAFSEKLDGYARQRDYFSADGTSKLSVYIRHGCVSIREILTVGMSRTTPGADAWVNELIWREFYQTIFYHYPWVNDRAFQDKYKHFRVDTDEALLAAFKTGQTGYPIIDAAMRCLNQTGWMHNRLRMVTASFLTKILLVDWKRGERYFSWKLLDYELQSNNGGWQWAAGIGCDAAPYFRIFNPVTQSETYDPSGKFIRQYCPELTRLNEKQIHAPWKAKILPPGFELGQTYPFPVVDYATQRQTALDLFARAARKTV